VRFEAAAGLGRSRGVSPARLAADGLLLRTARSDGASGPRNRTFRRWGRRLRGASCTPGLVADPLGSGRGVRPHKAVGVPPLAGLVLQSVR